MAHDLSGYEEVPDRIVRFKQDFPDGSLQGTHKLVKVGDKTFVEYIAFAYRTPDDKRPGKGVTWEPFPGTTPYTNNSEVENAETSAWGRALAAIGYVGKKIASANEVRNRQAEQDPKPARSFQAGKPSDGPSEPQMKLIKSLVTKSKATPAQLRIVLDRIGADAVELKEGWVENLTAGKEGTASALITFLKEEPLPDPDHPSDVPNDFEIPEGAETLDDVLREGNAGLEEAA